MCSPKRHIAELEALPNLPLSQQREMAIKHIKENGCLDRKTPQEIQQNLIRFGRECNYNDSALNSSNCRLS